MKSGEPVKGSLETNVIAVADTPEPAVVQVKSAEEYCTVFYERYQNELNFRRLIHGYLKVKPFRKIRLNLGRVLNTQSYQRNTIEMIKKYAEKYREDLILANEIANIQSNLKKESGEVEKISEDVAKKMEEKQKMENELAEAEHLKECVKETIEQKYEQLKQQEEEAYANKKELINSMTNTGLIVKEKLKEYITKSPLIKVDDCGNLQFDEKKIAERLEDLFLKDIVAGIEQEDGTTGFLTKVKGTFNSVITHWGEIEDIEELSDVEWVQSIINGRCHGYKVPQFSHLIAGKYDSFGWGRMSIDTAISIDSSGSMAGNKWEVAKKAALATRSLMRKLNPSNETFFSHFSDNLHPLTSMGLIRGLEAHGNTNTNLALEWLVNTLAGRGPSIAYLITDGEPTCDMDYAIAAAQKLKENPLVRLRIFLIDGNESSENKIRLIGKAAGEGTRVIPIKNYQTSQGVIRDLSRSISEMYDIMDF